ncbi:pilus (MSHA type) biogenesis protein MshL [Nitratiruptor sp. SB155-2]|uniref:pilus (MSHA type) biogenesis protein MshL n=1 Tax=Nitratiruptor sp. (strain SB155-2) TaxID=387092 RepID=UPI0001587240|nr:pilus (MSHA type) biogenesis protein MshL [Nitratiruptor sp. SB155-2]BAF70673.1 general secretory pathway protein D [Nitratiruptor sp. SB155-2]
MKKIWMMLLFSAFLFANNCDNRLFNLKAYGNSVTIQDVLRDLSLECDISILFQDKEAKKKIYKRLDFINVKNYTLSELLDLLLGQNNLFYTYEPNKNLIKIAYRQTKSFNIDYINLASMKTESRKSVTLGNVSGTGTTTGGYGTGYGSSSRYGAYGTSGSYGSFGATQGGQSSDYTSIITTSEFKFWDSLKQQLQTFLHDPHSDVFLNKDASIVTVTGTKEELDKVERFLQKLQDRMHKQVMIEAKIIEVQYNDDQTVGIDWSKFSLDVTGSRSAQQSRSGSTKLNNFGTPDYFIGYNFSMQGLLDFLKKYGKVKILSNPKVMTLNNQPAIINVGDQLSYRYENGVVITGGNAVANQTYSIGQTFVGISLYVIPEITENSDIIMKINPVTSALKNENIGYETNRTLPPDIRLKQVTSIVKVKDGQKILIGGLISKNYSKQFNKVPVLGDIPIIGYAFKSKNNSVKKSELFVLIIPKIVKEENFPTIDETKIFGDR